jgi:8-oxo-dGTP diphosphatase
VRSYPARPIVGVGAVIVDRGNVLLVRRAHPPLQGEWSLPGGAVEVGETMIDALVREVREETSLIVDVGALVDVIERVQRDAQGQVEYHFIVADFLCRVTGGSLVPASDAEAARWVPLDELAPFRLTGQAVAVIDKARRLAADAI